MIYPAHYLEIVLADVIGGYGYGGRGEGLLQTKHNAAVTGGGTTGNDVEIRESP